MPVDIENDLDSLFKAPLAEFTTARNALAARLKKDGHRDEAERVKSLSKPSSSAWAVNQLYFKHRDALNRLIETAERFNQAQASQRNDKSADMRAALADRRDALADLTKMADAVLRDAGHSPTPDTMRRIATTLEALSTGSSAASTPPPGRLTTDIGPPGFESLAAFASSVEQSERPRESTRVIPFRPAATAGVSRKEELRQAKIAAAKAALDTAERVLRETQSMAQNVAAELEKAKAQADEKETTRREAEERYEEARVAAAEARQRLQSLTTEATKAARLLENAQRALAKAREDLEDMKS